MNIGYHNRLGRGYEGGFSPIGGNDPQYSGKDGNAPSAAGFTLRNRLRGKKVAIIVGGGISTWLP